MKKKWNKKRQVPKANPAPRESIIPFFTLRKSPTHKTGNIRVHWQRPIHSLIYKSDRAITSREVMESVLSPWFIIITIKTQLKHFQQTNHQTISYKLTLNTRSWLPTNKRETKGEERTLINMALKNKKPSNPNWNLNQPGSK